MRTRMSFHLRELVLLSALLGVLCSPVSAQRVQRSAPTTISGTVRLYGCVPDPDKLTLTANPFTVEGGHSPDARAVAMPARFTATENPRVLSFTIHGLQPNTTYRLGAAYPQEEECSPVIWRGPVLGLATSGGPLVAIDGFAARTTIEVWSADESAWVGVDELQLEDGLGQRQFRWRSTLPGVVGGELQVSTEPFPTDGTLGPCVEPEKGVIHRRAASASDGTWVDVGAVDLALILGRNTSPRERTFLTLGAPVYVRVVPRLAAGLACNADTDGAAGWAMVGLNPGGAILPPPSPPISPPKSLQALGTQFYLPPYTGGVRQGQPAYGEYAFKIIKPHTMPKSDECKIGGDTDDQLGCALVAKGKYDYDQPVFPGPESWIVLKFDQPKNSGTWVTNNPLTAFVTSGVAAAGLGVTSLSKMFEEVKAEAVKVAVGLLNAVAPGACDEIAQTGTTCDEIVATGITIALVSAGIPPSLPNWDELKSQGADYAAAMVATEFENQTGVPSSLTEEALKNLGKKAIDDLTTNRPGLGNQDDWLIPYFGFDPATFSIELMKLPNESMPGGLMVQLFATPLYAGRLLPLPSIWPPNGRLRIPVVLKPNLSGLGPVYCSSDFYAGHTCEKAFLFKVDTCEYTQTFGSGSSTQPIDCRAYNLPEIFYRDNWINKKLVTACSGIAARTVLIVPFKIIEAPLDWRVFIASSIRPREIEAWTGALGPDCSSV